MSNPPESERTDRHEAAAGDEAFVRLAADGHVARMREDHASLAAHHDGWRALVA